MRRTGWTSDCRQVEFLPISARRTACAPRGRPRRGANAQSRRPDAGVGDAVKSAGSEKRNVSGEFEMTYGGVGRQALSRRHALRLGPAPSQCRLRRGRPSSGRERGGGIGAATPRGARQNSRTRCSSRRVSCRAGSGRRRAAPHQDGAESVCRGTATYRALRRICRNDEADVANDRLFQDANAKNLIPSMKYPTASGHLFRKVVVTIAR